MTQLTAANDASEPKKLKILMLHGNSHTQLPDENCLTTFIGYTQSGPLFRAKTRSLEKLLIKFLKPVLPTFTYPTAPVKLHPADIPGFDVDAAEGSEPDAWGWWKRETGGDKYIGLEEGLDRIGNAIRETGGIDAVIGFSQGAAAAAMVASLLQPGRAASFSTEESGSFAFPKSWEDLVALHPDGLRFAVSYSGFLTPNKLYEGFYKPKISCPTLHFIGSLDSVVEESRSLALVEACHDAKTVFHPGGHFVPVGKEMGGVLVGFIKECTEEKIEEKEAEGFEEMDMPF